MCVCAGVCISILYLGPHAKNVTRSEGGREGGREGARERGKEGGREGKLRVTKMQWEVKVHTVPPDKRMLDIGTNKKNVRYRN